MSTADRPPPGSTSAAPIPGEVAPAKGHAPSPVSAFSAPTNVPTPGVSVLGTTVLGAPTLPDPNPVSLTLLMQRMANELFVTPPLSLDEASFDAEPGPAPAAPALGSSAPAGSSASPRLEAAPSQPRPEHRSPDAAHGVPAPTRPTSPAATSGVTSPFAVAPSFDALFGLGSTPSFALDTAPSFSLLDGHGSPARPTVPAALAPLPEPSPSNDAYSPVLERFEVGAADSTSVHGFRDDRGPAVFDPHALKREFPILDERVHGKRLVWLDNAATTQKPRAVIDRLTRFYEHENSNIHRAAHTLAARATDAYESARETVRTFLNAPSVRDLIFVRGTTEGINLVAQSWGRRNVEAGDEIVITWLEHHANIVPWQQLCAEKGAKLRVAPVDSRGQIILSEYEKLLGPKTRLVSLTQVSNALGTITPAREMVALARRHGATVLVDGAQAVSHLRTDVQALDCDFYVFSGHKVFGPTGIGVVYGKAEVLEAMPPWQGGGNMIQDVTFERTVFHGPPARFEAGTGNIADAVGLGAALEWLMRIGVETVGAYEHELLAYGTQRLAEVPGLTLVGTAAEKAGVLSFVLAGQKTEQVGGLLDRDGIAVRSGHHCAQPILRRFGLEATVRASLAPYNTRDDIDCLVASLQRIQAGR